MSLLSNLIKPAEEFLKKYESENRGNLGIAKQAVGNALVEDGRYGLRYPARWNHKRMGPWLMQILLFIGILTIGIPLMTYILSGAYQKTATTEASIIEIIPKESTWDDGSTSIICSLKLEYNVDGNKYSDVTTVSSNWYCEKSIGDIIVIDYNPKSPESWSYNTKLAINSLIIFFVVIGGIELSVALSMFVIRRKGMFYGKRLIKEGRLLSEKGEVLETEQNSLIKELEVEFATFVFEGAKK